MTDQEKRGDYLAGGDEGLDLTADERAVLDRVGRHLADEGMWDEPPADGQFRLLAAAAEESRQAAEPSGPILLTEVDDSSTPISTPTPTPVGRPVWRVVSDDPGSTPVADGDGGDDGDGGEGGDADDGDADAGPSIRLADGTVDDDADNVIRMPDRRRGRGRGGGGAVRGRLAWFGAGAIVAAAAAVGVVSATGQLDPVPEPGLESELAVTATYELEATPLDPDAVGTVDVVPTPAGVELRLQLMGLDNSEGGDYYTAWLVGSGETVPLGSFHWRKGGVEIILWSGVDDPAYNRLTITRQTQGDGAASSGEVVLMAMIPELGGS